jgi:hypothetical protein
MKFRHSMTHDNANEILQESFRPRAQPGSTRRPNLAGRFLVDEFPNDRYRVEPEGPKSRVYDVEAGSQEQADRDWLSRQRRTADRLTEARVIRTLADINLRNAQFHRK